MLVVLKVHLFKIFEIHSYLLSQQSNSVLILKLALNALVARFVFLKYILAYHLISAAYQSCLKVTYNHLEGYNETAITGKQKCNPSL